MTWDVVVVGGGPVGLAAAIESRLSGLTVIVVEQRAGTIDKACGEGLMPGALPLLTRLGVELDGRPLRGVTYRQGTHEVTHRFAGGGGMGVRRTGLHDALAARAEELGVERMIAKVDGIRSSDRHVVAIAGDEHVTARYLLACDGLHSTVARLAGLHEETRTPTARTGPTQNPRIPNSRTPNPRTPEPRTPEPRTSEPRTSNRRYGVRQHFAIAPWSDNIEVYYGRASELYITPVSDGVVGVAMLARRGVDFDSAIAAVPDLAAKLAGAPTASSRRGAGPFRQRTRARTAGRILLVGDASGYVDAITGEGLRLGMAQAHAAVRCIAADRPAGYERAWRRETRDFRLLTSGLVAFAESPFRRFIVPLACRLPRVFGLVVERLAR